jgi:iron complex outermembrane receptor protein
MTKKLLLLTCAVGAMAGGLATAGSASAQTGTSATEVGAVVVTAEKRQVNIQKVPVAVTAFTAKQRDTIGIETLQDMTNFAPGLTYTSTTDHLYIRGVGRQSINLAADAGVASYTDGFYNPDPVLIVLPPMFIGNTEVLRGPQGTLQGRNGIAGALLVDSKRPTSTPYAEGRVTVGNYGVNNYEAAISGPLADGLNVRVAAFDENQEQGYFKNVAGGPSESGLTHTWYIESMVTAKLGDNTDFFAKVFTFGNNSRGGPGARAGWNTNPYSTFINDDTSNLSFNPAAAYGVTCNSIATCNQALALGQNPVIAGSVSQTNNSITGNPATTNKYNFAGSFPLQVKNHDDGDINYVLTHHFPGMDLKYTGGYQQYTYQTIQSSATFGQQTDVLSFQESDALNPTCANPAPKCLTIRPEVVTNYIQSDAWYSHEFTLASTDHGPFQWIGGVYYYHELFSNPVYANMPDQDEVGSPYQFAGLFAGTTGPASSFTPAPANPNRNLYYSNYHIQDESKAIFGQVDYKVTNEIKLTGGLRYTSDHKWGDEEERIVTFGGSTISATPLTAFGINNPADSGLLGFAGNSTLPAIDLTNQLCNPATLVGHGALTHCTINAATGIGSRQLGGTSSAVTGTAGIEWTPDSSTLGYLRYSRGYKELALNAGSLANPNAQGVGGALVAPETMDDYELGYKRTFGRNLVVDLDLFYEHYVNAQFPVTVDTPLSGGGFSHSSEFLSIPLSRSDGIELETIWTPVDHLQFLMSYAYNYTSIETKACHTTTGTAAQGCYLDVVNPNLGTQSIRGNELPNAPKNKFSLNGNYTFVFDAGDLTLSATYLWRDKQYGAIFGQSYWASPSWDQTDLRAVWRGKEDKYEIVAFGRNVFNSAGYPSGADAYQAGNASTPATYTVQKAYVTNPPAVYGMEFHYKFF